MIHNVINVPPGEKVNDPTKLDRLTGSVDVKEVLARRVEELTGKRVCTGCGYDEDNCKCTNRYPGTPSRGGEFGR